MTGIRIEDELIHVGDERFPLLAGEVQFWRMHPDTWAPTLQKIAGSGIRVVSTYLSWRRHEPVPGRLDLDGSTDPRLDAARFLVLCREAGLFVQLKPGPWICAEEPGGGYPDWIMADRELLALDDRGEPVIGYNPPFLHPVPSYTDETFLAHTAAWFTGVWDRLREFLHPHGPVIAVQLDNEPSICFQDSMYGADYSPSAIAAFRGWLRERYADDPRALTNAWGEHVSGFDSADPPRRPGAQTPAPTAQALRDWVDYKGDAIAGYLARLARMHADAGAGQLLTTVNLITHPVHDVPVAHARIRAVTGAATGEDHYYIPPLDTDDIHRLARSAATARAVGEPLPWVPELQAGIWRSPGERVDYPDPTPLEQEIWWGAAFALGFSGANLYMLADRENWEHAPLDDGAPTPFHRRVAELARLVRTDPYLLTGPARPDVVVVWHRPDSVDAYTVAGTARVPDVAWADPLCQRAYRGFEATLRALTAAGLTYALWPTDQDLPDGDVPVVIPLHCGGRAIAEAAAARHARPVIAVHEDAVEPVVGGLARIAVELRLPDGARPARTIATRRRDTLHVVHWGAGHDGVALVVPGAAALEPLVGPVAERTATGFEAPLRAGYAVYRIHPA